jgi:hypothetical protein
MCTFVDGNRRLPALATGCLAIGQLEVLERSQLRKQPVEQRAM